MRHEYISRTQRSGYRNGRSHVALEGIPLSSALRYLHDAEYHGHCRFVGLLCGMVGTLRARVERADDMSEAELRMWNHGIKPVR